MKGSLVKLLTLALNILGAFLLFYGLRQINSFYEHVYEIASTGSSSTGAEIADFPPSLTLYFAVIAAAGLCWWVSDKIRKRDAV